MTDFITVIAIVIFSTLTVVGTAALLLYLVHLPWREWALSTVEGGIRAADRAFYWVLDMAMGKHTCQKGKDNG